MKRSSSDVSTLWPVAKPSKTRVGGGRGDRVIDRGSRPSNSKNYYSSPTSQRAASQFLVYRPTLV